MMQIWILALVLQTAYAGNPDDAAALLSRFPAGQVPASEPVFEAIASLQAEGGASHMGVLSSLRTYESHPVQRAANIALQMVSMRVRLDRRAAFALPTNRDVRRWLSERDAPLTRRDGTTLGRQEQEVIAYAVLVMGHPRAFDNTNPLALLEEGERLEDRAEPQGALSAYAMVASQGNSEAAAVIEAFEVDLEKLLLAMNADVELVQSPPVELMPVLTQQGSSQTGNLFIERSKNPQNQLAQVVALDGLAEMLRHANLSSSSKRAARQQLEAAADAPAENLRAFARSTLKDVE